MEDKIATQMIEDGVSMIARGMYRVGDKSTSNNPQAAFDAGMAAISVIRSMALEFGRKAGALTADDR